MLVLIYLISLLEMSAMGGGYLFPCPFSLWFLKCSDHRLYQSTSNQESGNLPRHLDSLGIYSRELVTWQMGELRSREGTVRDMNLVASVNKGNTLVLMEQRDRRNLIPPLYGAVQELCPM